MKIAMVTSWLSWAGGGVSVVVEALSRAVAETGLEVVVFGLEDEDWREGDKDTWTGAHAFGLSVKGPKAFGYAPDMTRQLIEWSPDVVHVHGIWMHTSRSVVRWAKATGKPYMISPHNMLAPWGLAISPEKKRLAGWLYEAAHLRSAACLHALCASEMDGIRSFGLSNPVCVIPNGTEIPSTYDKPPAPWEDRFAADDRIMLFLGRFHHKKNLESFLVAWAATRQNISDCLLWRLVLAGWDQDGYKQYLQNQCRQLGLTDSVLLARPLFDRDKDAAFRNATAFVLPSIGEGLPMAVLEAWSYGLPVLMTDACNLPEGFEAEAAQRLRLSEPEMTKDLGQFLSSDNTRLYELGQNARRLVEERFRWQSVAHEFCEVYSWIKDGGSAPIFVSREISTRHG